MVSQIYYLLRSRADGSYLVAHPNGTPHQTGFLLVFAADYDALSYLDAHAPDLRGKFAVESIAASGLKPLIGRWNFEGLGMISDALLPRVEFFRRE